MRTIVRNEARAQRVIDFISKLPIVDGPAVGKAFAVDPWLADWIRDIYGPEYEHGTRVVRKAGLTCARKMPRAMPLQACYSPTSSGQRRSQMAKYSVARVIASKPQ